MSDEDIQNEPEWTAMQKNAMRLYHTRKDIFWLAHNPGKIALPQLTYSMQDVYDIVRRGRMDDTEWGW